MMVCPLFFPSSSTGYNYFSSLLVSSWGGAEPKNVAGFIFVIVCLLLRDCEAEFSFQTLWKIRTFSL